jgi:predicted dehydrogenase
MEKSIHWGIIGPGFIAHAFAKGLKVVQGSELFSVASRSKDKAEAFAKEFEIPNFYGSYEELLADPLLDIVYIATINTTHKECIRQSLEAGKHVVCEKPLCLSPEDCKEMFSLAKEKNLFLMEAFWSTFLPSYRQAKQWVAEGKIGQILQIEASFCFAANPEKSKRLFLPELGGGILNDVGIYTFAFALDFFNESPSSLVAVNTWGETGVDYSSIVTLDFKEGKNAILSHSLLFDKPQNAYIWGTEGHLEIPDYWKGTEVNLYRNNKLLEKTSFTFEGSGYEYEAAEAARCIREGKIESPVMDEKRTLLVSKLLEQAKQFGLKDKE